MKYCKNCKESYSEKMNFCKECGNKLVKMVEHIEKPKVKSSKELKTPQFNKGWLVLGALALIIGVAAISSNQQPSSGYATYPTADTGGSGQQSSPAQTPTPQRNCWQTQEAYTVQVPYTVEVPYQTQEAYQTPISYSLGTRTCTESWATDIGFFHTCKIEISNSDDVGGTFTVKFYLDTSNHGTLTNTKTGYISAHLSGTITSDRFDTDMGETVSGRFEATPPTKTAYRTVTNYRTETKYRDETRYRTVTKCA
jgi:hypothetical protein